MASVAHELSRSYPRRRGGPAAVTAASAAPDLAAEARLAQRAVAGDGDAFAELYGRYEKRAYNLCLRILGSEDDAADATQEAFVNVLRRLPKLDGRDLAFGSYVFTSARHACYDLIDRRKRAEPSDAIPESSIPVGGGVGGGGFGFDPGDPDDDPERNVLQQARSEEIRIANDRLPERQREVLALRELEDLSYDEIADIMDMNRNSVAQLISRARINLRDALRDTALASIATSSADCERAVALMASSEDGQDADGIEWLDGHVTGCETCRLSREAMEEAGMSYRSWLPVAAAPFLFRETMARAADEVGADWSEAIARHDPTAGGGGAGDATAAGPGVDSAAGAGASGAARVRAAILRHRRLDAVLMAALAAVLLLVVLAARTHEGTPSIDPAPTADETAVPAADEPTAALAKTKGQPGKSKKDEGGQALAAAPAKPSGKQTDDTTGNAEGSSPTSNGGGSGRRRPEGQDPGSNGSLGKRGGGGGERLAGDPPTATPPVTDPPATVTPDPPVVVDPPPSSTGQCRDANGNPIQCPTPEPPRIRCPTGCIRLPPSSEPPR